MSNLHTPQLSLNRVTENFYTEESRRIIAILQLHIAVTSLLTYFDSVYVPQRMIGSADLCVYKYRLTIATFSRFLGREATLSDLTDETVAAFLRVFVPGRSPATTNTALAHLKAIGNFAARRRLCDWLTIRPLKTYRRVPKARTAEEVSRLLDYCDTLSGRFGPVASGPAWKALFGFIYDTAVRIGACLAVRQDDCDLTRRWVLIRAENQKQKADQVLRFSEATAEYLEAIWMPRRKRIWEWAGSLTTIYPILDKILVGAGLPHGRKDKFHVLRKTSLSYTAKAYGRAAACDKAGHSSMAMTDRYLDPTICGEQQTPPPLPVSERPKLRIFVG